MSIQYIFKNTINFQTRSKILGISKMDNSKIIVGTSQNKVDNPKIKIGNSKIKIDYSKV